MTPIVETETVEVRVTAKGDGVEFVDRDGERYVLRAGQRAHLPVSLATRLARAGQVDYLTCIKALVDNLTGGSAGDLIMARGDVAFCPADRAARLVEEKLAVIVPGPPTLPRIPINPMAALTAVASPEPEGSAS